MSTGKFIVFSGGEGSGKSTILRMLTQAFPGRLIATREPGGTPVGQRIRAILLDDAKLDPHGMAELHLFTADRWEHVSKVIEPALTDGQTIISDRHWMDTYAYQWYATMDESSQTKFTARCIDPHWPKPDLWIWFDVEPEVGLRRRRNTQEQNRLDDRDLRFHAKVQAGFQLLFDWYPGAKLKIDANEPLDTVYQHTTQAVSRIIHGGSHV